MSLKKARQLFSLKKAGVDDTHIFSKLVTQLYIEDHRTPLSIKDHQKTLEEFSRYPNKGRVYFITQNNQVIGYVILVAFWANEYGGNIVAIDELFVIPESRNQGIGTQAIEFIQKKRPWNAVGLYLVTSPDNHRAQQLYQKLGFKHYEDKAFIYEYK